MRSAVLGPGLLVGLVSLVGACSGLGASARDAGEESSAVDAGSESSAGDSTTDGTEPDAGDPRCAAFDTALQAGLDDARKNQKAKHAVLGVITPECGKSVHFSDDASSGDPPTGPEDLWRIGSITKTFVAAAVLALAADGKLGLDDPLSRWIDGFPNGGAITLRQVANHSSGIYDYTDSPKFLSDQAADPKRKFTPAELVAYATAEKPYFAPGQGWHYSNTNYVLLGLVIAKAGADTAVHEIHAQAISKAGLAHTFLDGDEPLGGTLVHGYAGNVDATTMYDLSAAWTAGAIVTTASDLLDWASALYGSTRVLSASSLSQMVGSPLDAGGGGYGLGVDVLPSAITDGNGVAYGHGGAIWGFMSQMSYFPEKGRSVVSIVADTAGVPNDLTVVALEAFRTISK